MAKLTDASIWDANGNKRIARIGLNGYKSHSNAPIATQPQARTITSFAIYDGDRTTLIDAWSGGTVMLMRGGGVEKQVRVAAYPTSRAEMGLLEFL